MKVSLIKSFVLLTFLIGYTAVFGQNTVSEETQPINKKRYMTVLTGVALSDDHPGFHAELARGYQPGGFGIGAFMSFIRIPAINFTDWTVVGLQLRVSPAQGDVKPYCMFDYGIINMVYIENKVNMRTATLDLGGGLEKQMQGSSAFLVDFRWKRFLDYQGERDAYTVWTINVGLRF